MFENRDDEVNADRPRGQLSRPREVPGDDLARAAVAAENPEAAGVRDSSGKLWPGSDAEPDREDGIVDAQLPAQRRM